MRVAMLLHKSVEHDSRVRREARALAGAGHQVIVLHLPRERGEMDGEMDGFQVRSVTLRRRLLPASVARALSLAAFVWALIRLRPDAVHAHDAAMLVPGAVGARASGALLVYDSHELATGVPYRERLWAALVATIERLLIRRAAAVITVSDGIAERLRQRYGLSRRPIVVRNLPDPAECDARFEAPALRETLRINPEAPLVLHLGAVAVERGCETLVRAMAQLPEAHLLFLGADDAAYAERLRSLSEDLGVAARVHLLPSVPVGQIRAYTRQASVGLALLEDTCENHRLALPNKAFEYVAAEVPVVASDLPELRALLDSLEVGRTVDASRPEHLANGIADVLAAPPSAGSLERAAGEIRWSTDSARLIGVYEELSIRRRSRRP